MKVRNPNPTDIISTHFGESPVHISNHLRSGDCPLINQHITPVATSRADATDGVPARSHSMSTSLRCKNLKIKGEKRREETIFQPLNFYMFPRMANGTDFFSLPLNVSGADQGKKCASVCVRVHGFAFFVCVCVCAWERESANRRLAECYNEDYFPSHEKGLYQATTHRPRRTQALVAPVDQAQEITVVTRPDQGQPGRWAGLAKGCKALGWTDQMGFSGWTQSGRDKNDLYVNMLTRQRWLSTVWTFTLSISEWKDSRVTKLVQNSKIFFEGSILAKKIFTKKCKKYCYLGTTMRKTSNIFVH